ncbi:hypothetical protein NWP22_15315 [Anabaenopsis tanganyikae CS-531]|uniref:Uncharacterized protein n=2 Tax=Anabaenopsis TaxID=110103 RepID=A0ABT5AND7_9CYAN|nr:MULTISPECIES: hypothetical protein [Anabaenopsis]MDB9538404.1 hypothetical protein [Anabaenopsis arnoldii]MDH6090671.1 hypothetical protein [Anabaenopsis arnoldii]MDH6107213.1 hypothetical protein [Anabaenopsis tanganyikae CS-531]
MLFNKWNVVLVLLVNILATACAGMDMTEEPQSPTLGDNRPVIQQEVANVQHTEDVPLYPGRYQYQSIPLENVNAILQGSDPVSLALNVLEGKSLARGKQEVAVFYPQPRQALVEITHIDSNNYTIKAINYRVEMTTFGRSLLNSSPPIWQVVWAGSKIECTHESSNKQKLAQSCEF